MEESWGVWHVSQETEQPHSPGAQALTWETLLTWLETELCYQQERSLFTQLLICKAGQERVKAALRLYSIMVTLYLSFAYV